MNTAANSRGTVNRETYLKHLLTQAAAAADESFLGLKELRDRAIALVGEQAFPSKRDEEWRFTDLSAMLDLPFQRAKRSSDAASQLMASPAFLEHLQLFSEGHCFVSLNGHMVPNTPQGAEKSESDHSLSFPEGAIVGPLSQLLKKSDYAERLEPILAKRLAQVQGGGEVFTALNTAGFSDVMVVWLPADTRLDAPVCLVRATQGDQISYARTLVIAERHANLTLVESFSSAQDGAGSGDDVDSHSRCNNSVTEIWLEEGAKVNHVRLQDEGKGTFHIGKTAVSQAANSQYICTSVDLGAQLSRHHLEVYQAGPQTDTQLYGVSALRDRQLADTHSLLTLTHPHGSATQIQKNIVDDRAHSVFNGKVYVSQDAQLTDASQLNRNLMLSSKARVDTKPELDIVADNVKCAHGATVSQLQADEVFYLQSRGISAEQAQRLLLYGFAMEIVDKISLAPLRASLSDRLNQWAR